jgi:hypothetical protein
MADTNLSEQLLALSIDAIESPSSEAPPPPEDPLASEAPLSLEDPPLFEEEGDLSSALLNLSPFDIESEKAFRRGSMMGQLESEEEVRSSFSRIGARPGISLVEDASVLSFGQRAAAQAYSQVEDRVNYLNTILAKDPNIDPSLHRARYDTTRGLIIPRYNDKTGKVEDVAIDPSRIEPGDLADFSSEVIPTLAAALIPLGAALKYGSAGLKAISGLRGMAGMSAATAGSRQASEAAFRAMQGLPQPTTQDVMSRGGFELATDFLFNYGLTKGVQLISGIGNRLTDPAFKNYKDSLDRLNAEFGNNIVPTLGEESNLTPILKLEQFQQKLFLAGEKLRRLNSEKERAIVQSVSDFVESQVGKGVDVDAIDPSFGIINQFNKDIRQIEADNFENADELIDSAVSDFMSKFDEVAPKLRFANTAKAGKFIRNSIQQKLDFFRESAAKNYGDALLAIEDYKKLYGDQIDFDFLVKLDDPRALVNNLAKTATSFRLEKAVDPTTLTPTDVKVPIFNKELMASSLGKWARVINRNKDGMSLTTAIDLRRQIDDDIDVLGGWQSGGIPKNQIRELQSLRGSIQKSIDDAVDSFPDSTLKQKWKDANSKYAADRDKFKISAVNEILENAPADRIPDIDVLSVLAKDNKNYLNLKSLFSADPATWSKVKRAIIDSVANPSEISEGLVNPDDFVANIKQLPPAVLEDIFGSSYKSTLGYFDRLSKAIPGKTATGLSGDSRRKLLTIDPEIIQDIIRDGGLTERTKSALRNSIAISDRMMKMAKSELGKKLKDVPVREALLSNDTFVGALVESATDAEAKAMASRLGNGEASQLFRQKVLRHYFEKTKMMTAVKELKRGRPFDFKKGFVGETLRDELERKRSVYGSYLGEEVLEILESFVGVGLFTDETARRAGRNVGSLVAGENMSNIVTSTLGATPKERLSHLRDHVSYMLVSTVLANPLSRKLLLNRTFDASNPLVMLGLVGSEMFRIPFLASYEDKELGARDLADLIAAFTPDAEDDLQALRRVQGDPPVLMPDESQPQPQPQPQPEPAQQ